MFRIGSFAVRWYGLFFALSFYLGYLIMERIFKKEDVPIPVLDSLATYMIIATVIGARLGHVLFYQPGYYFAHPIEILKIWEGGLASHGAALGIIFALWLFSRNHQKTFFWTIDRIVIVVALAGFFIRMGNLMNSEIYGTTTNLPWGFIFVNDRAGDGLPHHPTQIYEALSYLAIFGYLLRHYIKKNGKPIEGYLFSIFLILVFGVRFIIEFIKNVQVPEESKYILDLGQILSIPLILAGGVLLWYIHKKERLKSE
ncbi:MAG: prolipoprotein diacylglyceryl transferase [Bacteroidota bacterium]|nr:prolipoprotein diacylglyceryl transferase [Bacteroidota bacterium]